MVVWLYVSEVISSTHGETIVSVKLEDSVGDRVGVGGGETGPEVEVITNVANAVGYLCPYKFFNGVVKGETGFGRGRGGAGGDRFFLVLKLVNKVFVAHLGETTTFFGIKVDVINIEFTF